MLSQPFQPILHFSPTSVNKVRYQHDQLDVRHAAGILATQFDYAPALNIQQPPLLDTTLEIPSPGAHHVTYSSTFPLSTRNQLGLDFPVQSPANSRFPPSTLGGGPSDFRYNSPSERRLPGGPSHDQVYPRPNGNLNGVTMESDHRPHPMVSAERTEPSTNGVASGSRESRKEISTVVIACRQWYVLSLSPFIKPYNGILTGSGLLRPVRCLSRSRKIRCDSTRPVCNNCVRRSNACEYDAVPKRRGPDKRPGTRQRSCKKRPADGSAPPAPKRKRTTSDRLSETPVASKTKERMSTSKRSPSSGPRHTDRPHDIHPHVPVYSPPMDLRISTDAGVLLKVVPVHHTAARTTLTVSQTDQSPTSRRPTYAYEQGSIIKPTYPRQPDTNDNRSIDTHRKFPAPSSPTVESTQKLWWDSFSTRYPYVYPRAHSFLPAKYSL